MPTSEREFYRDHTLQKSRMYDKINPEQYIWESKYRSATSLTSVEADQQVRTYLEFTSLELPD